MQSLSVIVDRELERKIPNLLANIDGHVGSGLLIGQRTQSSIFVVHLARTAQLDGFSEEQVRF